MQEPANKQDNRLEQDPGGAFGMQDGEDLGVARALREFQQLDYGFLVPFRKIFSADLLRKKAVRWILFFGLLPLFYPWLAGNTGLSFVEILWLVQLYFCLFWALYFYSIIQPTGAVWRKGLGYAAFTAFAGIPVLLLSQHLPVIRNLYHGLESESFVLQATGYILGVGVLEESCKALPLLTFGLRRNTIRTVREGLFLGLLSGLGFAAAEGVTYNLRATVLALQHGAVEVQILMLLHRVISGPLLHGCWAGVVGWFIGVAAQRPGPRWPLVVVGVGLMAVLHGLFDVFSSSLVGIGIAAVGYLAFMGYLMHGEDERRAEQLAGRQGLSAATESTVGTSGSLGNN